MVNPEVLRRIEEKKARLHKLRPLPKEAVAKLREEFLVRLAYNSNAIEGNTLTLGETRLVIEEGLTIGGKSLREHLEARNHIPALEAIEREAKGKGGYTEAFINYLHGLVLKGISESYVGKYRDSNVRISGSDYHPPSFHLVPHLMREFTHELNERKEHKQPVSLAAWAHFQLVHIHPFLDGNGRTARLLMNLTLLRNGYPITIIQRADRKGYYRCLEQAHRGNFEPFEDFVARAVERSLDLYLEALEPGRKPEEELISLARAAKSSPYSAEYLGLLARKGVLEAAKIGRNWKTTRKAVKDYQARVRRA